MESENKEMVVLEWIFTPPDYFEEPFRVDRDNYEMTIENGKVEARMEAQYYDSEPDLWIKLHESLYARFLVAQILNAKPFELPTPNMIRILPDGKRHRRMFADSGEYKLHGQPIDFRHTAANGDVLSDTRRERIEKRESLSELVEKHREGNATLQSLLNSLQSSVLDRDNELIHLYEVREALAKKLGGEDEICSTLGISKKEWSELGRLANYEPLKQGRHRGNHASEMRDATEDELIKARRISQTLLEKYLDYLDERV
ncbi:hypothetical protein ACFLR7_06835 [Acidobacteriota bacterium]